MCSSKARYLIFFQYFGTKYSGVMKAPIHQNVLGVQNYLEDALRKLRPVNEIAVFISSRTDSGVHALQNSAHVEIQRKEGNMPFSEQVLVDALNYHLQSEPIRTYLYRFVTGVTHHSQIPVFERNLCWALPTQHFSTEAVQDAAQLLKGTHDFSTFRSLNSETPFRSPVKTLQEVTVAPVESSFSRHYCHQHMQYWELTFQSKSFLYKQVRRMTGALVAVGQGRLTPKQLQDLLDVRNSLAFPQNMIAPPDGLFLKEVKYENFRN
ncbi:tRNA pseudouridine synthase-like 1 isoform X2 [Erpetoichthys calabaricus]|uniref:tRNA pseudouridine synthase-like 1 isoform X2 n=1 Tax=Erpetoichthys calabaricus TaxID=27687 RepID=UPI002234021E|nr:tRNA pseudouridine synthase-like 1 isoform X2 [Erpetoichthys calabaricus]